MIQKMLIWSGIFALLLITGSCGLFEDEEPADEKNPPSDTQMFTGTFRVKLVQPLDQTEGYTSVVGQIFDGPTPSSVIWEEAENSGHCRLLTPRYPFCEQPCGGKALCVEDGQCQSYPLPLAAGKVKVEGLKDKNGETSFSMDPIANNYQPPGGTILEFPPCAEGDTVTFTVSGDSAVPPFTLSARSINPLKILNDTITLEDGQSIDLKWTPPDQTDIATISVEVDISHHGGTKGLIECSNVSDNGSLKIPASLVDALKALGMSGFPKIEITRRSKEFNSDVGVGLAIESLVTIFVDIPGLISCNDHSECPEGQSCQDDFKCK